MPMRKSTVDVKGQVRNKHGRRHDDRLDLQQETPVRTFVERLVYDLFSVGVLPYRTHSTTGPRRSEVP